MSKTAQRKLIDLPVEVIRHLEHLAVDKGLSVKKYIEGVLIEYASTSPAYWQHNRVSDLTQEQKEDLGLFLLMLEVEKEKDYVTEERIFEILDK